MKEYIINVEGMACSGCEKRVINVLSQMPEVKKVTADHLFHGRTQSPLIKQQA